MVVALPRTLLGTRDRALLFLGFAGAFRRSELVALRVEDLQSTDEDSKYACGSKTDQEGQGLTVGIPGASRAALCPIRAMEAWLAAAELADRAVFRR
jgi:hypothetical protein